MDCAPVKDTTNCYFHSALRFNTSILAHMLDSLVRVSRRGKENHFANTSHAQAGVAPRITRLGQDASQRSCCKQHQKYENAYTGFLRFPFSNFRYSLTLFSKFFASFPHGTCTLSVSHQYLALDGIYHLI